MLKERSGHDYDLNIFDWLDPVTASLGFDISPELDESSRAFRLWAHRRGEEYEH